MILPAPYWVLVSARQSRAAAQGVWTATEPLREPVTWAPVTSICIRLPDPQVVVMAEVMSLGDRL